MDFSQLRGQLLQAPDGQLDPGLKQHIELWPKGAAPSALQILELLDKCTYTAGASEFVMLFLNAVLKSKIEVEKTTYETVVSHATWRKNIN